MTRRFSFVSATILAAASVLLPRVGSAQNDTIRLNEVDPAGRWVELTNTGNQTIDISGFFLCNFPSYEQIQSMTVVTGSVNLDPGAFVVVEWQPIGTTDGEIGLYRPGTGSFGTASNMLDYMQYVTSGHTRENVAVTNGFWEAGTTVGGPGDGLALSRISATEFGSGNWTAAAPTPGAANQTATSSEEPGIAQSDFGLSEAYPNPFSRSATFSLTVEQPQHVTVEVFDVTLPHGLHGGTVALVLSLVLFLGISFLSAPPRLPADVEAVMEL